MSTQQHVGDTCYACDQKIRPENKHQMCKQKVRVLEILARSKKVGNEWVKVMEGKSVEIQGLEMTAPYRARAHVSRLVWFGLAEHGRVRSGLYRITPKGVRFLFGNERVPAAIYCKDGKVVSVSLNTVALADVKNVVLDKEYWDNYGRPSFEDSEPSY